MKRSPILVFAGFVLATGSALAQATLTLPDASPAATVSQTVGLTNLTIDYHRPAVNKRKVWGELVPYGDVWRAGANMNTTLTSSSAFTVGGKALAAGTYGLHMIPTEKDWTVIFTNMHTAWGSFSYDQKEDAVRFTVTPKPADFEERLEYRFEDPTDNGATVVLQWEKLAVSFPITVDSKAVVFASIEGQLRGLPRFGWQGWNQAANWCLRNDYKLDQGLAWADHSIGMQSNFNNLRTKAAILEKKGGDPKEVEALRAQAMKVATESGRQPARLPADGREEDRRSDRALPQERQGLPELLEHVRQPRRGPRQYGRQEGRHRVLLQGPRHDDRPGAEEADQRHPGQAQGLEKRRNLGAARA